MAKWGEGDPRWIVEERADGTNVNNWHWTEKNATEWSKNRLKELLANLGVENENGACRTTEVTSIEGEATANNRKAKLIFFYEFVVKIKWKGTAVDGTLATGTIDIPNISEENDLDDIEVNVKLTEEEIPARSKLKALMRKDGVAAIKDQIGRWMKDLRTEYAKDLILPTDKPGVPSVPGAVPPTKALKANGAVRSSGASSDTSTGTVEYTDTFKCQASDLFVALVDESRVQAYTQAETKIDSKVGGTFSMFGGHVSGVFKELVPHERIVMAWRFRDWTEGLFSNVTITLTQTESDTKLQLVQTGVPTSDIERTREGWRMHQFERMKMILGFGSGLQFSL